MFIVGAILCGVRDESINVLFICSVPDGSVESGSGFLIFDRFRPTFCCCWFFFGLISFCL